MKRLIMNMLVAFALVAAVGLTGCKKESSSTDEVKDKTKEAGDATSDMMGEAADKVEEGAEEAGEALEDALGE